MTWVMVGLGGGIGAMMRHGVNVLTNRFAGTSMPYATAIANILGCALIGVLAGLVAGQQLRLSPEARTFVFVGLLGGFTTFSTFGLDTMTLVSEGRIGHALLNVALQVGLGLGAVFAGYALAHAK
jgi:CrcB protein